MKLQRSRAPMQGETIVSLIDVVFFLLVFFMLVGRLDATAPFDVTPPETGIGADLPGGGSTIAVGPDGALALDGRETDRADLLRTLADQSPALVRINADSRAELRHFLPLATRLEEMGIPEIVLVVTPNPP